MSVTENVKNAVASSDLTLVRSIILRQFDSDRELSEYESIASAEYAETQLKIKGISLYDDDDRDTEFTESKDDWGKDLWQAICIEMQYNFSEQKLKNVIKMMRHLQSENISGFTVKSSPKKKNKEGGTSANGKKSRAKNVSNSTSPQMSTSPASRHQRSEKKTQGHRTNNTKKGAVVVVGIAGGLLGGVIGLVVGRPFIGSVVGVGAAAALINHNNNKRKR